jgi:anthranilate phosphoribosyltransferase
MRKRLANIKKKFPEEVGRALYQETEVEATEAKKRTPVKRGNLRASIFVLGPSYEGRSISNAGTIATFVVAGGVSAPYAVYVHENLEAFHKVGQAKFIESVINESRNYIATRIAKRLELAALNA